MDGVATGQMAVRNKVVSSHLLYKFAKSCVNNDLTRDLFPLNPTEGLGTRNKEKYRVVHANTGRLKDSAVPYLQRLLNANQ